MQRIILSDVDNTLFSWIDYFAPCFRALVHAISRESRIPESELYTAFQLVFQREGSVEFRRAIQENLLIKALPLEKQERLLHVGKVAFGQASRHHLRPYPSVIPTLSRLRQDGVRIVAVTNSGAMQAMHRLRQLRLAKMLDGLVAWHYDTSGLTKESKDSLENLTTQLKPNPAASQLRFAWDHDFSGLRKESKDNLQAFTARQRNSGIPWVAALPREQLKPNPAAYLEALARLNVRKAAIWIIGDSLQKDLSAAGGVNATSVWAKYGHVFDQRNFDTLVRITHWSQERINATYDTTVMKPDHIAEDFSSLLDFVGLWQRELF